MKRIERPPTAYAVFCKEVKGCVERCSHLSLDGAIFLTQQEYEAQMDNADYGWTCPICGGQADWDDDNYDRAMAALEVNDN